MRSGVRAQARRPCCGNFPHVMFGAGVEIQSTCQLQLLPPQPAGFEFLLVIEALPQNSLTPFFRVGFPDSSCFASLSLMASSKVRDRVYQIEQRMSVMTIDDEEENAEIVKVKAPVAAATNSKLPSKVMLYKRAVDCEVVD